jgi:hypothetical protein
MSACFSFDMVSSVTEVSATETLRLKVVRCDADVFGEFVDFLFGVVDPQREGLAGFPESGPAWKVTTARRQLEASGLWQQVRGSLDLTQATFVEVTLYKIQGASMTLRASRSSGGTLRINATPGWLDANLPRIESEARSLTPAWGRHWSQYPFWVLAPVALAVGLVSIPSMLTSFTVGWAVLVAVSAAAALVSAFALRLPLLQLGPLPAPRWRKTMIWILSAFGAAAVGVVVTRIFDAINPPSP